MEHPKTSRSKPKPPIFIAKPPETTHNFWNISWNQLKKYYQQH